MVEEIAKEANMAKYEKTVVGDFDTIVLELDQKILNGGMSMNLVDENSFSSGDMQVLVRVYDKYFMRTSSRASLSLTVVDDGRTIYISAIGAGGGQGVVFNFSWGVEDELVAIVSDYFDSRGEVV
jgi:hypothetical protein